MLFHEKLQEIKQQPYRLRRMINKWPYYDTLKKTLQGLSPQQLMDLQQSEPLDSNPEKMIFPSYSSTPISSYPSPSTS